MKQLFWHFPDMYRFNRFLKPMVRPVHLPGYDYTEMSNWLIHPEQFDLGTKYATKYPAISEFNTEEKPIDLFFVHRTTMHSKLRWNSQHSGRVSRERIMRTSVLPIINAFSEECTIYVPMYKQATLYSFFEESEYSKTALNTAYEDVREAFLQYLREGDARKPLVLAGHSQGACHIARLIKEVCEPDDALFSRILMVYLVGWPIENDYFNRLKPVRHSLETGGYVSWCTFGMGGYPPYFPEMFRNTTCTNPVTWSLNTDNPGTQDQHLGGITYDLKQIRKRALTCQVSNNVLQISHPNAAGFPCIPKRDFVKVDFHLFHNDIKFNFKARWKEHQRRDGISKENNRQTSLSKSS